jgi:tetratricopeptide (TPR) repeat protein
MCGFVDCVQLLVEEGGGDVEGMQKGCPEAWAAYRRAAGHIGRTPLCAASAEESYPLAGCTRVAAYLLKRGADPLAAGDNPMFTPFAEACGNNSYPIVKLMLDNGLCKTCLGVGWCKGALMEMRRQLNTLGWEALRPLVALLSRAIETAEGVATDEKQNLLKEMNDKNRNGEAMLRSADFAGAAWQFKASVEYCQSALAMCTDVDATAAWKKRFVTCCCKAAASCLKLGASKKAEFYCGEALRVQPPHAEAKVRLGEARAAHHKFEEEVHGPWLQARADASAHSLAGRHREAAAAAQRAVEIARGAGDAVLEAKAKVHEAETLHSLAALSEGELPAAERDAAAAWEVIDFCRSHKERYDFLLTNITTGTTPSCMLDTCEAHAWLDLARQDIEFYDRPAAGRDKLTGETLRLLARVEELSLPGRLEVMVPFIGCSARHLIFTSRVLTGEWPEAIDAAKDQFGLCRGV